MSDEGYIQTKVRETKEQVDTLKNEAEHISVEFKNIKNELDNFSNNFSKEKEEMKKLADASTEFSDKIKKELLEYIYKEFEHRADALDKQVKKDLLSFYEDYKKSDNKEELREKYFKVKTQIPHENYKKFLEILKITMSGCKDTEIKKSWNAQGIDVATLLEEMKDVKQDLKKCFIFKMRNELGLMLWLTDPKDIPFEEIKLPYDYTFIDVNIRFDDFEVFGLYFAILVDETTKKPSLFANVMVSFHTPHYPIDATIITVNLLEDADDNFLNDVLNKEGHNVPFEDKKAFFNNLRGFALNFITFLNNPELEYVIKEYVENENNGHSQMYSGIREIVVYGKLKRYIEYLTPLLSDFKQLRRAHWVRGHWRKFYSERFVNKIGNKTWIYPFIRGLGDALMNEYNLVENREEDLEGGK